MQHLDVVLLSRLQFAVTIMFHYLFPPLSIGLGWVLVVMEGLYLGTRNPLYERLARFWTKIFAVNFAMGVATGIVMEFEFGTNWAAYSRFVGDVFGSALASEGIFAFFLESGFLAVLVFGWDRVPPKMHLFATCMVAFGATFSSVWIVVANSWMQTPAGFHVVGVYPHARAEITDFWAMVFNPSAMTRLSHVIIGALVLGGTVVCSISCWYLLKKRHQEFARASFQVALGVVTVASLLTLVTGHRSALTVSQYQPAKLAALEGHFHTGQATLWLFGVPDANSQTVNGIGVPGGLSFLVNGDFAKPVAGLDQIPRADWPQTGIVFQTYHLMVVIGLGFIGLTLLSQFLIWRGKFFDQRWLLVVWILMVFPAYIANQSGWVTAEVGRQPWIVYGLMRTSAAVSKVITSQIVLGSLILFSVLYLALFLVYVVVLNDKIQHGPTNNHPAPETVTGDELLTIAGRRTSGAGDLLREAEDSIEDDPLPQTPVQDAATLVASRPLSRQDDTEGGIK